MTSSAGFPDFEISRNIRKKAAMIHPPTKEEFNVSPATCLEEQGEIICQIASSLYFSIYHLKVSWFYLMSMYMINLN